MYSSEDLERFYFQYQTEAMPKGISVEQFCSRNKGPYNIFYKWYKDTRKKMYMSILSSLSVDEKLDLIAKLTYENGIASLYQHRKILFRRKQVKF